MDSGVTETDTQFLKKACVNFNLVNTVVLKLKEENERLKANNNKQEEEKKSLRALVKKLLASIGEREVADRNLRLHPINLSVEENAGNVEYTSNGICQNTSEESCLHCPTCQKCLKCHSKDKPVTDETSSELQTEQLEDALNQTKNDDENLNKGVRRSTRKSKRRKSVSAAISTNETERIKTRAQRRDEAAATEVGEERISTKPRSPTPVEQLEAAGSMAADVTSTSPSNARKSIEVASCSDSETATSSPLTASHQKYSQKGTIHDTPTATSSNIENLKVIPDNEEESAGLTLAGLKEQIGVSNSGEDPEVNLYKYGDAGLFGSGLDDDGDEDDSEIVSQTAELCSGDVDDAEKIVKSTGTQKESSDDVVSRKESSASTPLQAMRVETMDHRENDGRNKPSNICKEGNRFLAESNIEATKSIFRIPDIQKESSTDVVDQENIARTTDAQKESSSNNVDQENIVETADAQKESSSNYVDQENIVETADAQKESCNIQDPEKTYNNSIQTQKKGSDLTAVSALEVKTMDRSGRRKRPRKISVTSTKKKKKTVESSIPLVIPSSSNIETAALTESDVNEDSLVTSSDRSSLQGGPLLSTSADEMFTPPKPPGLFSSPNMLSPMLPPSFLQRMKSPRSSDGESMKSPNLRRSIDAVIERLSTRVNSDASASSTDKEAPPLNNIRQHKPSKLASVASAVSPVIAEGEPTPKEVTVPPAATRSADEVVLTSPLSSPTHQGVTIEDIFREMSSTTKPDELLADMEKLKPADETPQPVAEASESVEEEEEEETPVRIEEIFNEMHLPVALSPIHDMSFDSNPLTPIDTNSRDANDETCTSSPVNTSATNSSATPPTPSSLRKVVEAAMSSTSSNDSGGSSVSKKNLPFISLVSSPVKVCKSAVISRPTMGAARPSASRRRLAGCVEEAGAPVRKKSRTLVMAAKKTPRAVDQAISANSSSGESAVLPSQERDIIETIETSEAVTAPVKSRVTATPKTLVEPSKRKRCTSIVDVAGVMSLLRKDAERIISRFIEPIDRFGLDGPSGGSTSRGIAVEVPQNTKRGMNVSDVTRTPRNPTGRLIESPRQQAVNSRLSSHGVLTAEKGRHYTVIKTEDSHAIFSATLYEILGLTRDEVAYHRLTPSNIAAWMKTLMTYTFNHDTLRSINEDFTDDHTIYDILLYTNHDRELEFISLFGTIDKQYKGAFMRRTLVPNLLKFLCRYCIALGRKTYVTEDQKVYDTFSELFTGDTDVLPHEYCCSLARIYCLCCSSNDDYRSILELMRLLFINCCSVEAMSMAFEVLINGVSAFDRAKLSCDMVILSLYFHSFNLPDDYQKGDSIERREFMAQSNSQRHLYDRAVKADYILRRGKLRIGSIGDMEMRCDRLLNKIIERLYTAQLRELNEMNGIYELFFNQQVDTYTSLEFLSLTRGAVYSTIHIMIGKLEPILQQWMLETTIKNQKRQQGDDGADNGDEPNTISDATFIATLRAITRVAMALTAKTSREDPNKMDKTLRPIAERICGLCTSSYTEDDDEERDGLPVYSDLVESAIIGTAISFGMIETRMVRECLGDYVTYSTRLKIKPHPLVQQISAITTPIQIKEILKFIDRHPTSTMKLYPFFYSS